MVLARNIFRLFILDAITAAAHAAPFISGSPATDVKPVTRSTLAESAEAVWDGCFYQLEDVGAFNSQLGWDFTTLDILPAELIPSTYTVGSGPYAEYSHTFFPENIIVAPGQPLQMLVPGDQTTDPLSASQMVTAFNDVLYASVRTVAQTSPVNGTVHGFFMYMNDTQETDIEIRTGDVGHVHCTNQVTHPGVGESTYAMQGPDDMSSAFHEYRYDWLPHETNFYIDGELIMSIIKNVPSEPGWLMWNNWSNGYAWTFGPPLEENAVLIKSITAYFNRTSIDTSSCDGSAPSSTSAAAASTSSASIFRASNSSTTATTTSTNAGLPSASASSISWTDGSTPTFAGVTFLIELNVSYSGSLITLLRKRDSTLGPEDCMSTCASSASCAGTAFDSGTNSCLYYSSVDADSQYNASGTTFALVQARAGGSTTSSSASSNTASSITASAPSDVATTSSTTTASTPAVTVSCPTFNSTVYTDPNSGLEFFIECDIDHAGGDLDMVYVADLTACIAACADTNGCVDVSLSGYACYMKRSVGIVVDNMGLQGARLITSSTSTISSTTSIGLSISSILPTPTTSSSLTTSSSTAKTSSSTKLTSSTKASTSTKSATKTKSTSTPTATSMASVAELIQLHVEARLVIPLTN